MQELTKSPIWLQGIMAVMLFVPAGTLHFWEAWAFWLLFSVLSTVVTFYFLKHDPGLVKRRLKVGPSAEHEKSPERAQGRRRGRIINTPPEYIGWRTMP
jgi:hypothetical protein